MYRELVEGNKKLAVIGLGYVGLPIALEFAGKIKVIGYDIRHDRIDMLKNKIDPSRELEKEAFVNKDIIFSSEPEDLREASFYVIAVPTPINIHKNPDLRPLLSATETIAGVLKKGDYVVYESTVYPGCTEEDCVPILEKNSGLKFIQDFKVGFSPERINPGDKQHTLTKVVKVTSGCDPESAEEIARIYEMIIEAGVYRSSSIKIAEAAKIIENTQRDINIAFMNELSMIFNKMDINTFEVLEAAGTKWNFLRFYPGLVGGHCIGVDPYYLTYRSAIFGHHARIINAGRGINDEMGAYVAKQVVQRMFRNGKSMNKSRVLIMGITFKENVSDIRNSKVTDIIHELRNYGIIVDIVDPNASSDEVESEYGFRLAAKPVAPYDAVIVAVGHKEYLNLDEEYFKSICTSKAILADIKGLFRGKIKELKYWSL